MSKPSVREERTGWRDEAISRRHREWGCDLPAIDIDFLLLECGYGTAVALVEYKHERAKPVEISHPSYRALADLGTRARIPVFITVYAGDFSWWRVLPLNNYAKEYLSGLTEMSEHEWVAFQSRLRKQAAGRVERISGRNQFSGGVETDTENSIEQAMLLVHYDARKNPTALARRYWARKRKGK